MHAGNVIASLEIAHDSQPPTVTFSRGSGQLAITKKLPIVFVVAFSEPIFKFDEFVRSISLEGSLTGTYSFQPLGGTTYELIVYDLDTSEVWSVRPVFVPGTAFDAGANGNRASIVTDGGVTFDNTPLTVVVSLSDGQAPSTNQSPLKWTITFNKVRITHISV